MKFFIALIFAAIVTANAQDGIRLNALNTTNPLPANSYVILTVNTSGTNWVSRKIHVTNLLAVVNENIADLFSAIGATELANTGYGTALLSTNSSPGNWYIKGASNSAEIIFGTNDLFFDAAIKTNSIETNKLSAAAMAYFHSLTYYPISGFTFTNSAGVVTADFENEVLKESGQIVVDWANLNLREAGTVVYSWASKNFVGAHTIDGNNILTNGTPTDFFQTNVVSSRNFSLTNTEHVNVYANLSAGATFGCELPPWKSGLRVAIKKGSTGRIEITPRSTNTVDGSTAIITLSDWASTTFLGSQTPGVWLRGL